MRLDSPGNSASFPSQYREQIQVAVSKITLAGWLVRELMRMKMYLERDEDPHGPFIASYH
jgi:hypothetical protein